MFDSASRRPADLEGNVPVQAELPTGQRYLMHRSVARRLLRTGLAAVVALAISAAAAAAPAAADTPNANGVHHGNAQACPSSPAYDAPRPAGAGTGRRLG